MPIRIPGHTWTHILWWLTFPTTTLLPIHTYLPIHKGQFLLLGGGTIPCQQKLFDLWINPIRIYPSPRLSINLAIRYVLCLVYLLAFLFYLSRALDLLKAYLWLIHKTYCYVGACLSASPVHEWNSVLFLFTDAYPVLAALGYYSKSWVTYKPNRPGNLYFWTYLWLAYDFFLVLACLLFLF